MVRKDSRYIFSFYVDLYYALELHLSSVGLGINTLIIEDEQGT